MCVSFVCTMLNKKKQQDLEVRSQCPDCFQLGMCDLGSVFALPHQAIFKDHGINGVAIKFFLKESKAALYFVKDEIQKILLNITL